MKFLALIVAFLDPVVCFGDVQLLFVNNSLICSIISGRSHGLRQDLSYQGEPLTWCPCHLKGVGHSCPPFCVRSKWVRLPCCRFVVRHKLDFLGLKTVLKSLLVGDKR